MADDEPRETFWLIGTAYKVRYSMAGSEEEDMCSRTPRVPCQRRGSYVGERRALASRLLHIVIVFKKVEHSSVQRRSGRAPRRSTAADIDLRTVALE